MSVSRQFRLVCDWCHHTTKEWFQYSEDLKIAMRKEGWHTANKDKCPMCLGDDPNYWEDRGYVL